MTRQEKFLYHQIHPAKLATDWATGILALYFFWRHNLVVGLMVGVVPSVLASYLVVRLANLERLRKSRFGRYIGKYMNQPMQLLRIAGYVIMALGAWWHVGYIIGVGFVVVLGAWLRGVMFRQR